ncbi:MAG: hypothetical protein WKF43_11480 [Acidimicrobiales bacterium]
MFTGIVEELGSVRAIDGNRIRIGPTSSSTVPASATHGRQRLLPDRGGVGATVVGGRHLRGTLSRTNLETLRIGDPVNLERPVRLSDASAVTWSGSRRCSARS